MGAAYRSALAAELRSLGFGMRPAGRGQWEVDGIPQEVLEAFSKRSHQIEERVGRDASAAQKQVAALATRASKDTLPSGEELESRWREELTQTGIDPWWAALNVDHDRTIGPDQHHSRDHELVLDPPEIDGTTPMALAASALFRHETVIDRQRLLEKAFIEAGLLGLGPDMVYEELSRLEEAGSLLKLDSEHWTTPGLAAIEAAMLRAAARPQERDWFNGEAVKAALAAAPHLSDEQRDAVLHAVRSDGVGAIEAGAGTGKTTLAKVLVDAARRSGLTVIGLAPSWVAADELSRSTGIEALAIARWRWARDQNSSLNEQRVILIDEAGMVGTRDMEAVLTAAATAGAKVVLIGDRRQLEAVPGASALRAVSDIVQRSAILDHVRRQQVDWQRAASVLMARGDTEAGLRAYASHDRLELAAGDEAALSRVLDLWRDGSMATTS
ncbi:MAG: AAA family ATPase [Devosia sp.]